MLHVATVISIIHGVYSYGLFAQSFSFMCRMLNALHSPTNMNGSIKGTHSKMWKRIFSAFGNLVSILLSNFKLLNVLTFFQSMMPCNVFGLQKFHSTFAEWDFLGSGSSFMRTAFSLNQTMLDPHLIPFIVFIY